jgi:hypothetical protein
MGFFLGCIGTWLLSDAVISIALYLNAASYNGKKQSWGRDHLIRVVRGILALIIILIGYGLRGN